MKFLPWLYSPNGGVWLIWFARPVLAVDWLCGFSVRLMLRSRVHG